jgi:hypothetical protein
VREATADERRALLEARKVSKLQAKLIGSLALIV